MLRNELTVSQVSGESVLLINGFRIDIRIVSDPNDQEVQYIKYVIIRKQHLITEFASLQEAVDWCKD